MDNQTVSIQTVQRKQCYRDGQFHAIPENRHELWLSTKEANRLFEKSGKRQKSLIHTIIKRMVLINQQAAQGKLYAITLLYGWVREIKICSQLLRDESIALETTLKQDQQHIYPPKRYWQTVGVSYQSIGLLLNLIIEYDRAIWLTNCAKNIGVYDKVSHYCRAKTKIMESIYPSLLKIIHYPIHKLANTRVSDYLNDADNSDYVDINPKQLLEAIQTLMQLNGTVVDIDSIRRKLGSLQICQQP